MLQDDRHDRPGDASDATVDAVGKLSKAVETMERARGHLYSFHQLSGTVDLQLQDALQALDEAGHESLTGELRQRLVGRNVIADRWTFQIVEDYDDGYYAELRAADQSVRETLMSGRRHVYEAEMKHREINPERPSQQPGPGMASAG